MSGLLLLIGFDTLYLLHWNRQKLTKRDIEYPRTSPAKGQKGTNGAKKTAIITARMTPTDKREIVKQAKKAKMTVTEYLTTCSLGKEIVEINGLEEVLSELKAQGRNLNQLTTLANMGKIKTVHCDDMINAYNDLCEQVKRITDEVT